VRADDVFITIGSGDISGVYFPAGLAIARLLNHKRQIYGIRATVEATTGSTFNVNAIMAGYLEFGLTQSDQQYQAVNGLAEWADKGPQTALRSVFSLHHEALTLVAAVDAGIRSLSDLKGKTVSNGNLGANQHRIILDALAAAGLNPQRDIDRRTVLFSNTPVLLQDHLIDAFFFTVGHPDETIATALSGERSVRIIPIAGPAIDQLIAENPYYAKSTIAVTKLYPEAEEQPDAATFGVIATLCTSASIPADVVYALTREVFENFEAFRQQHPAFADLSRRGMLEGLSAPLHPGALRYYRETGLMP
jgi:TRAP transporter TAXI family solute receptor